MLTAVVPSPTGRRRRSGRSCATEAEDRDRGRPERARLRPEKDPNPIAPEVKELVWGGGSFVVFAAPDAVCPVPALKQGHGRPLRARSAAGHERRRAGACRGQGRGRRVRGAARGDQGRGQRSHRRRPPELEARAPGAPRRGQRPASPSSAPPPRTRGRGRPGGRPGRGRGRGRRRRRTRPASWPPGGRPTPTVVDRRRRRRDERGGRHDDRRQLVEIADLVGAEEHHVDDQGDATTTGCCPRQAEIIYGIARLADRLRPALEVRRPPIEEGDEGPHRADPEGARRRRQGQGRRRRRGGPDPPGRWATSRPSGQRLLAEADAQAERCSSRAGPGSRPRSPSSRPRPTPTSPPPPAASATSCGPRSPPAGAATDRVVDRSLDDATQQQPDRGLHRQGRSSERSERS